MVGRGISAGAGLKRAEPPSWLTSVIAPRFFTRFALKPSGEKTAAALIGSSNIRKVRIFPEATRDREWLQSVAEQQPASTGRRRKTSAIKAMTIPAMTTPGRNSGARRARTRPV